MVEGEETPQDFVSLGEKFKYERSCAGKDEFPSEESAIAFREAMVHQKVNFLSAKGRSMSRWRCLEAYHCDFCGQFHLGHPKD